MTQNRTHTCGALRLEDSGARVRLCGWLENVREVGGSLVFVVLRDFNRDKIIVFGLDLKLQALVFILAPDWFGELDCHRRKHLARLLITPPRPLGMDS